MGDELTTAQKNKIINSTDTITVPKTVHREGRTHGHKNNSAQVVSDSMDLAGATVKDINSYTNLMQNNSNFYDQNIFDGLITYPKRTNQEFDDWILSLLRQ